MNDVLDSKHLFENASDFWTTDDESVATEEDAASENDGVVQPIDDAAAPPPKEVAPADVPFSTNTSHAPPPAATRKGHLRKRWVVEDKSDVSSFYTKLPNMAIEFPFELDDFQKRAILHLEQSQHVFVAAHTSAGKTVVAEYAIALALQRQSKVVYTSPVKALSNQKYLEFKQKFDSVGIITGDVSINSDASCVIMTTEILRSALYRSDPIIGNLSTVIFDEVHYINDSERGVVWEEVILLLPDSVNMVMLSATAPNYREFADWIGRARKRDVFAVLTLKRPVPLKHYIYFEDKSFLLMDANEIFKTSAYNDMFQYSRRRLENNVQKEPDGKKQGKGKNQKHIYQTNTAKMKTDTRRLRDLIRTLEKEQKLPVVVFCFSRKKCEEYAAYAAKEKFIGSQEESKIHLFLKQSLSNLSEDDQKLPQIKAMSEFLLAGVGLHHGGLLPIMKEIVELLFSRGLIRVLFATETFAMGVNMPAKSVVFSSITKHDGTKTRPLLPSEYTQMAGRAGRRGLDDFGSVYVFCSADPPNLRDLTLMMINKSTLLTSQFRVTFLMILQLLNSSSLSIEDMMSKSFKESTRLLKLDVAERDYKRCQKKLAEMKNIECILGEPSIEEYVEVEMSSRYIGQELHEYLWSHNKRNHTFCAGRVIVLHSISNFKSSFFGMIVCIDEKKPKAMSEEPTLTCLALLPLSMIDGDEAINPATGLQEKPSSKGVVLHSRGFIDAENVDIPDLVDFYNKREYRVYSNITLDKIAMLTTTVVMEAQTMQLSDPVDVKAVAQKLERSVGELKGKPIPIAQEKGYKQLPMQYFDSVAAQRKILSALGENKCHNCPKKEEHFTQIIEKRKCIEEIEDIEKSLEVESLECYHSMKEKIRVLQMFGFVDEGLRLTLKGKVACTIMTGDDIILPQAIMENVLEKLTAEEVVFVIASFVGCENVEELPFPTNALLDASHIIYEILAKFASTLDFRRMEMNKEAFRNSVNHNFGYIAYMWACGTPFYAIMEKTALQEGTIVRSLLRLDELMKKLRVAMEIIGNKEIGVILEQASEKIRRDIIFNLSLYLQ